MRVYLTNVEGICRRFVDEKRESLLRIKETTASFKAYWASQNANDKKALVQHKGNEMLKVGSSSLSVALWKHCVLCDASVQSFDSCILDEGNLVQLECMAAS